MSEYIEIETEPTADPDQLRIVTNLTLAEAETEEYHIPQAMEEGSPLAQSLSFVEGVRRLRIEGQELLVSRDPDVPWHLIVADISAAIRDFFL